MAIRDQETNGQDENSWDGFVRPRIGDGALSERRGFVVFIYLKLEGFNVIIRPRERERAEHHVVCALSVSVCRPKLQWQVGSAAVASPLDHSLSELFSF